MKTLTLIIISLVTVSEVSRPRDIQEFDFNKKSEVVEFLSQFEQIQQGKVTIMGTNEQVGLSLMSEESVRLIGKALDFILVNGEIDVDIDNTEYEHLDNLIKIVERTI